MTLQGPPPSLALSAQDRARVEQVETVARAGREGLRRLLGWLDDESWAVRRAVVAALARRGDESLGPLCDILREERSNETRLAAAVDAIAASAGDAKTAMIELTHSSARPAVVCDALQVLGRRKERGALGVVVRFADHPDDNVAVAAIEAMGRIGGVETVEPLLRAVQSKSFFRTFPAIDALGRTRDARAVEPLAALTSDPLYAAEAIRALGRTGQPGAIAWLGPALARPNDALVRTAAVAVADLADHREAQFGAAGAIAQALRSSVHPVAAGARLGECFAGASPSEQVAMTRVLGWLGDDGSVERLVQLLDGDAPVAAAAASALRAVGDAAAPRLVEALRHADSARRARLLPLLGFAPGAIRELVACLDDAEPSVRALACEALARAGDASAVSALFRVLDDPDPRVAQGAAAAVQALGSADAKRLALERAGSGDPRMRKAALRIVSYFAYPEALDLLVAAAGDADERIREAALAGLPRLDDARASAAILAAASHADARTRAAAVRALGEGRASVEAAQRLAARLRDEDAWVRYYACRSLAKLRVEAAAGDLVERIDDDAGQVRVAAVDALAQLGGARAVEALTRAAEGDDADLRRAALFGLATVRDPSVLPILRSAAAGSDDATTRLVAVCALGELEGPEVVPALAHAGTDPNEGVAAAAIGALSTRAGEAASHALVDLLVDPSAHERALAALAVAVDGRTEVVLSRLEAAGAELSAALVTALIRMGRPSAIAAVATALTFTNVHARRAAAAALASLGTPEAIQALRRGAADDDDPEVRRLARPRPPPGP